MLILVVTALLALVQTLTHAQTPPSAAERQRYTGLHAAAARGDAEDIERLLVRGGDPNERDGHGRTPLHVAAFGSHAAAVRALVRGGANPNALDVQRYDIVTIAAVQDDVAMVTLALSLGTSAGNITSPYNGTALIAAAHLGHAEVVRELIKARAPLDHVNNLGWTALLEAVILGDGGRRAIGLTRSPKASAPPTAARLPAGRRGGTASPPLQTALPSGYRSAGPERSRRAGPTSPAARSR